MTEEVEDPLDEGVADPRHPLRGDIADDVLEGLVQQVVDPTIDGFRKARLHLGLPEQPGDLLRPALFDGGNGLGQRPLRDHQPPDDPSPALLRVQEAVGESFEEGLQARPCVRIVEHAPQPVEEEWEVVGDDRLAQIDRPRGGRSGSDHVAPSSSLYVTNTS